MLADSNNGETDNTDIPLGIGVDVGVGDGDGVGVLLPLPPPLLPLQADNNSPVKTIIFSP